MHKISNKIVRWLLQGVIKQGIDLSSICKSHRIDLSEIASSGNQLTSEQFAALMRSVFELVNDESAGYTDKPLRLGTFRMLCHATIECSNLRQALLRMMLYFRLLSDELDWTLTEKGEEATLTFQHHSQKSTINGYFATCMLTIIWRWSAWMVDYPLLLNRVNFTFPDEDYQSELNSIFRVSVYCNQSRNQLVLPSHYLNLPIRQNSTTLVPFLQNSPECLLSHYEPDNSISSQVRAQLELADSLESASLTVIAKHFSCSGQTLARRLRQEGHQFQELKDKVRKGQAINLLLRTELSISQISSQLGFSEDSVFYRTFKKWTGSTPGQFRQHKS